jgi:hypothetical protein
MDAAAIVEAFLTDLALVATSGPNERLPKEEQMRCSIYVAMRPQFQVVCAERGYGSIDDKSRTECDLWATAEGHASVWLEFKKCWSASGWNNKPPEQLGDWEADLAKLRGVPTSSQRYFLLVGFFDFDPLDTVEAAHSRVVGNIRVFHAAHQVHSTSRRFTWRAGDGISWAGAWVWHWDVGAVIEPTRQPTANLSG